MFKILFFSMIFLTACASKWKRDGVSYEKQDWRFCSLEKDGPQYANKGFCYIDRECKYRFFKKCRPVPLFCPWPKDSDISCLVKYKILGKKIRK